MKIGLYGSIYTGIVHDLTIPYIGIDGGTKHLIDLGISPMFTLGDYDSLKDNSILNSIEHIILPKEKDDTDLEAGIKEAISRGYDEIDIYGVTGYRLDHFFAAIRLLVKYKDYKITIYDELNKISLLNTGTYTFEKTDYTYISFFSVSKAILTLKNVKYPLDHFCLLYQDPLCVSNEIIDKAYVEVEGEVFIIQSKDRE